MSWWTPANQAYGVAYLINNGGLTPYGAAGLVSRWMNVEASAGPTAQGGYLGRAFGIAQWLGPRLAGIQGDTSYDGQLAYVVQELNGTEARAAALLRSASNADDGARAATAYERAGGWNPATNTDNYTGRTAAGIPAVLANANQAQVQLPDNTGLQSNQDVTAAQSIAATDILTPVLLVGIGGLLLYLVID